MKGYIFITKALLPLLVVTSFVFGAEISSHKTIQGCERRRITKKLINLGWPVELSCHSLIGDVTAEAYDGNVADHADAECIVTDAIRNETLLQEKITVESWYDYEFGVLPKFLQDTTSNTSSTFYAALKVGNSCWYEVIELNVTTKPESTCVKSAMNTNQHIEFSVYTSGLKRMVCSPPTDGEGGNNIDLNRNDHNYTVTWYRNCTELDTSRYPDIYRKEDNTLSLDSFGYEYAGVYSCAFTYNGVTRFIWHFDVCVEPKPLPNEPQIVCPTVVKGVIGQSVTISCTTNLGFGPFNALYLSGLWKQENSNRTCVNYYKGSKKGSDNRSKCGLNPDKIISRKCFLYNPPDGEKVPQENKWTMNLTISNFQMSDIGNYTATFAKLSQTAHASVLLTKYDSTDDMYFKLAIALGVVLGAIIFVLVVTASVVILCRCFPRRKCIGK